MGTYILNVKLQESQNNVSKILLLPSAMAIPMNDNNERGQEESTVVLSYCAASPEFYSLPVTGKRRHFVTSLCT